MHGNFLAQLFANGSSHIQGIDFGQSYIPVVRTYSFRFNIAIGAMHRLTDFILDVISAFQNMNVPIHERFCISPQPYYLY